MTYNNGSILRLLQYFRDGADKDDDFCYFHNLPAVDTNSLEQIAEAFEYNHSFCKRVRTKAKHIVLSFHKDSTPYLDDAALYALTAEFLRLRAPNAIGYIQKHVEKDHHHLHVCLSGNNAYSDTSIRLDKAEYVKRMKELESFQMAHFKELDASLVYQHQKEKKVTIGPKETCKQEILKLLTELADKARHTDEFLELIAKHTELECYAYRNKINGVFYKGKKYRFKKYIPERYSALEQLQKWHELSKGDQDSQELTR